MERKDAGMVELRDRHCLPLEAHLELRVLRQRFRQNLDGDAPVEPPVECAPDFRQIRRADVQTDLENNEAATGGEPLIIRQNPPKTCSEGLASINTECAGVNEFPGGAAIEPSRARYSTRSRSSWKCTALINTPLSAGFV